MVRQIQQALQRSPPPPATIALKLLQIMTVRGLIVALVIILGTSVGIWERLCQAGAGQAPKVSSRKQLEQEEKIQELIGRLGSAKFSEREAAMKELERMGPETTKTLREAGARVTDPELRRRIEQLTEVRETKEQDRLFNDALRAETVTKDYKKAAELLENLAQRRTKSDQGNSNLFTADVFIHLARSYRELQRYSDAAKAYSNAEIYANYSRQKRDQISAEWSQMVTSLMSRWEKTVKDKLEKSLAAKALAAKYPLVLLHSRRYAGGGYLQSVFSFIYETSDENKHGNDVQILFDDSRQRGTFRTNNLLVGQQNHVADLGPVSFDQDPDPKRIDDTDNGWQVNCKAIEGHVYLERVRDNRGNRFYVIFQVMAVAPQSEYMAFVWRRLPGGKVVKQP
jgi:hypothetical protein